jgi:hypothetical protein
MNVKSVITELQYNYQNDEDIILMYWDKFSNVWEDYIGEDELDPMIAEEVWSKVTDWVMDDDILNNAVSAMVNDAIGYYYVEAVKEVALSLNEDNRETDV